MKSKIRETSTKKHPASQTSKNQRDELTSMAATKEEIVNEHPASSIGNQRDATSESLN